MWALSWDPAWTTEGSTERRRCNCSWEPSCLPLSRSELQDSDSRPVYCSPLFRKRKQRQAGKLLIILWKLILSLLFRSPQELPETMQVQLPDFLSSLERISGSCPFFACFQIPLTHSLVVTKGWAGSGMCPFLCHVDSLRTEFLCLKCSRTHRKSTFLLIAFLNSLIIFIASFLNLVSVKLKRFVSWFFLSGEFSWSFNW